MNLKRRRATPMAAEDRRAAIVAAVVPLLEQHGGDVSTRQIAEAAGIAEGTIFRVFPDKKSLFLAVAEETVAPEGWQKAMADELDALPGLQEKVVHVVERMVERTRRTMLVLAALRGLFMREGPPASSHGHRPGPPTFMTDSARQLHQALLALVFEPHSDELRVPPAVAARTLISLVHGTWHPGTASEERLSAQEIADVLLNGVAREGRS
jgi:AcrR family transcriptional regulator